jgi:CspA family cold shock protein
MSTTEVSYDSQRLTGKVKWFNNKAGYGFITVCDGENAGKDIFVHYTSIKVEPPQYKYLMQGEYVDFSLVKSDSDKHEYLAVDVTGIKGGAIMCETRRVSVASSPRGEVRQYKTRAPREDGESGEQAENGDGEFVKVQRKSGRPKKVVEPSA